MRVEVAPCDGAASMRRSTIYEKVETRGGVKMIVLASGRRVTFWDAISQVEYAESTLARWLSRAAKLTNDEWEDERLESRLIRLEELLGAHRHDRTKREKRRAQEQRIERLRNVAGRTPEERASFLRKADELERRGPSE